MRSLESQQCGRESWTWKTTLGGTFETFLDFVMVRFTSPTDQPLSPPSVLFHFALSLPPAPSPFLCLLFSLPSPVLGGVVNAMSCFFPQCSVGCQCRRWTPSRQLCVCWALWFTVQGHSPRTGNLWKLPLWQPSPQVSFYTLEANQNKEAGNQGRSCSSLLCATINCWPLHYIYALFYV